MDAQFTLELTQLLYQSTAPDTTQITEATRALETKYLKEPSSLLSLLHIMGTCENFQVRQLAAIEARKLSHKYWPDVPAEIQNQVRANLLEITIKEPESIVRHAFGRVIAALAKIDLPDGKWNDLSGFLVQAAMDPNDSIREMAIYVLYSIAETVDLDSKLLLDFVHLFSRTITDSSRTVRVTSVQGLGAVAEVLEADDKRLLHTYRDTLPSMLMVLQDVVQVGDEDACKTVFDVFNTFLIVSGAIISKVLGNIIELITGISTSKQIDDEIRCMALSFIISCIRFKSRKLQALKLGKSLILSLMQVATEDTTEDVDEDCPARLALRAIDLLSTHLSPNQVFYPMLEAVMTFSQSPEPGHRKAALLSIGVAVEGSSESVASSLPNIFPLIVNGLCDVDMNVRQAALLALSQIAVEIPMEVSKHHAQLLPLVFELMSTQGVKVGKSACNCIDALLEGLDRSEISGYLPMLMERLVSLLDSNVTPDIKSCVAAAIGSAAFAAQEDFLPYFERTMASLSNCLHTSDDDEGYELRGTVMDTLGAIANAVGKQAFLPFTEQLIQLAYEGIQIDHSRLRECSFCFYAVLARVYKEEFAPFLPHIVPALFKSLDQDETDVLSEKVGAPTADEIGQLLESSEANDEEDDEELEKAMGVNSAIAMEKEIAADALGEVCTYVGAPFAEYLEPTVEKLVASTTHFYEGVRKSSLTSLWRCATTFYKACNLPQWKAGLPLQVPVPDAVQNIFAAVRKCSFDTLEEEYEKTVATDILRNLAEAIKTCGPVVLGDDYPKICEIVMEVLQKQHIVQAGDIFDEDFEEEDVVSNEEVDDTEQDAMFIDSACDVVIALSMALGESFVDSFQVFFPHIIKYYSSNNGTERAMAVACMGEVAGGIESAITPFTADVFTLFMTALEDPEGEVRSNAAYSMGLLCQFSTENLSSEYLNILHKLQPFFTQEIFRTALDNAIGCISRLILHDQNAIPLDQVLPIVFSKLPLKEDYLENAPLYYMILHLYRQKNPVLLQHLGDLIPVFASVLTGPAEQLNDELRSQILNLLKEIAPEFQTLISTFPHLVALLQ
ncbi:karyopherin Kap123 [Schizosaccharomyces cryophilus OY26]|uniref:Karyopherin Kap123 n=1 Tax=Schizosaccharomyces cryophilus (strain OY26 / ATCC MYA-4695 / CBS 11777 / NBRC 106824 / NRRL Y48691) TaxID=653667 RepID=S9W0U9_SCHCR|nr:karyopherin Kap123 [Schizosaccharomyces cryophilus OY26]EPY53488.1 karyopherin Kap123 [Schizosaccharomyces cryophilus OY26]